MSTTTKKTSTLTKAHALGGVVAVSLALLLSGCGSSGSSSSSSAPSTSSASPSPTATATTGSSTAAGAMITIKDFSFSLSGTVKPGATVMVMNNDTQAHTVTADGKGGFDVKVDAGATVTFKAPSATGSYPFHCAYHANMHGTLKVG